MNILDAVNLTPLMKISSGRTETIVGLIDGFVAKNHPDLISDNIHDISGHLSDQCVPENATTYTHGTFITGVLCGKRSSIAPAICPNCTLLVRPIFTKMVTENGQPLSAKPEELAAAIVECIEAGASVLNLSLAVTQVLLQEQRELEEALNYAARRGAIIVAAAGNQSNLSSSVITRHPGVIPVVACDLQGRPIGLSNLGSSIGKRGLLAPGENVISLGTNGKPLTLSGTSIATPFVTGAIALLWSEFPTATVTEIKLAITQAYGSRRKTVVPPLLDVWGAYQTMLKTQS